MCAAGRPVRSSAVQTRVAGSIEPAQRTESGQQLFDQKNIERIRLIKHLNTGYPLREIRDIFLDHPEGPSRNR